MKVDRDYIIFFGIIILLVSVLIVFYIISISNDNPVNNVDKGNLILTNDTMICDFYYLCFFREDGKWHKPGYNAGTNLIVANKLDTENEQSIKNFFKQTKINIVVNTTEGVVETIPFAYYLSYYYNTFKGEQKQINSTDLGNYNLSEPALIILGPGPNIKDSIKFEGTNLVVSSKDRNSLSLLLGKLLLIIVS
jgi:hypothetical protein